MLHAKVRPTPTEMLLIVFSTLLRTLLTLLIRRLFHV